MWALAVTALLGLAATADEEPRWEQKARTNGVTVYTRERPGSDVKELKSIGLVDAPPPVVLRILNDHAHYKEIMPYTEESKLLATEGDGKVIHSYQVINAPLVSRRDYALRVQDESDWKDGKGFLKTTWKPSEKAPPVRDGVVRVKINEGSWYLEPIDNGTRTRATYLLYTDPGGSMPSWVINKANSSAIPDIYEALRKYSKDPRYAEPAKK